jgi:phage terminase small subunit
MAKKDSSSIEGRWTDQMEEFCWEYVRCKVPARAYRKVYKKASDSTIYVNAYRLMKNPKVKIRVEEIKKELKEWSQIEVEDLVEELRSIAFSDLTEIIDDDGNLISIKDIPEDVRGAIQIYEKNKSINPLGVENTSYKVKMHDKLNAINAIAKLLGLYAPEKRHITGNSIPLMNLNPLEQYEADDSTKEDS